MNPPASAAGPWRVSVASALILVLELAFIRQVPAEVRAVSYFTNLVLMASFFGLGVGCLLASRRDLRPLFPIGLLLACGFILATRGLVVYSENDSVHFWLSHDIPGQAMRFPLLPTALLAFVAVCVPFLALGQTLAREMDRHPRLVAYGWDIAGSLAGTLAFSWTAFAGLPPWLWVAVSGLAFGLVFTGGFQRVLVILAGASFLCFAWSPLDWEWSPYYFVQHRSQAGSVLVFVNSSVHQAALDFRTQDEAQRAVQAHMLEKWGRPYAAYRQLHGRDPARVLVLGAGTGNDVHVALLNGASRVVAVEIDPVILDLGRRVNPTRPYDDPRVEARVDDARHVLRTSHERFDMVVFGTLDSQVLLSGHANLRLENYVYTRESMADARRLLAPGGVLAIYYSVYKPWLIPRFLATVREAVGDRLRLVREQSSTLFNTQIIAAPDEPSFAADPSVLALSALALPSTDDWPFLYLERPTVAPIYRALLSFVGVLVLGAFLVLRRLEPSRELHINFLFLGLGFTLVESAAVVRLALLFGSTWLVNAAVFASVLTTIFVANALVQLGRAPGLPWAWSGLVLALFANWGLDPGRLVGLPGPARAVAAGLLVGAPVFCAALAFSHLFGREPRTGYPLGINLIGAMAGGMLEYTSMLVGLRAVWLLALAIYLTAWMATSRAVSRVTVAAPPGA